MNSSFFCWELREVREVNDFIGDIRVIGVITIPKNSSPKLGELAHRA